jgi:hypothetical protein
MSLSASECEGNGGKPVTVRPEPSLAAVLSAIENVGDGVVALSADVRRLELSMFGEFDRLGARVRALEEADDDRPSKVEFQETSRALASVRAKVGGLAGVRQQVAAVARVALPKGWGEISLSGFSGWTVAVVAVAGVVAFVAWVTHR